MDAPSPVTPPAAAPAAAARPVAELTPRDRRRLLGLGSAFAPGLVLGALLAWWIPTTDQRPTWWAVLAAIAVAQIVAHLAWTQRGAAFTVGRPAWAWTLAGGAAVGAWGLLLFEPLQRALHARLIAWTLGSPWEGLAEGLVWTALVGGAGALALAGWLAWRRVAHAVLDGQLPARVPHDLMWTAGLLGLLALALAASAPLGLGPLGALEGPRWEIAAQALSVVVDDHGLPLLVLWGAYAAMQLLTGWSLGRARTGPPVPLLVLLDLDPATLAEGASPVPMHRLGVAWAGHGGEAMVVRPAARARHGGGSHSRWCAAADRLGDLRVDSPATARRWAGAWLARPSALPVLEAWVATPDALPALVAATAAARPATTFVLLAGPQPWPGPADLEALRRALPAQSSWALMAPDREGALARVAAPALLHRVATLPGRLDSMGAARALARQLTDLLEHPPPRQRCAVLARPAYDAWCDRLVPWLDQRRDAAGRWVDAMRPALDDRLPFDHVVLALDARWLALPARVRGELEAMAPLLSAAGRVSVVLLGAMDPPPTRAAVARALAAAGWPGPAETLGPAAIEAGTGALVALAGAVLAGTSVPLPEAGPDVPRRSIGLLVRATERTLYAIGPLVEALQRLPDVEVLRPDPGPWSGDPRGEELAARFRACALVLAVVDPEWGRTPGPADEAMVLAGLLQASDAEGVPVVVPLLLDGQPMPAMAELPVALAPLAMRQAIQLDVLNQGTAAFDRLTRQVAEALDGMPTRRPGTARQDAPPGERPE